jgi:AbrB family looped-hinge helix DNA binding protein
MSILTVTAQGQVAFPKEVLQHLGIKPGATIELDLLPNGRAELRAAHPREAPSGSCGESSKPRQTTFG